MSGKLEVLLQTLNWKKKIQPPQFGRGQLGRDFWVHQISGQPNGTRLFGFVRREGFEGPHWAGATAPASASSDWCAGGGGSPEQPFVTQIHEPNISK